MICYFRQFSAKKIGLKNLCYGHIFAKTSGSLSPKRQYFADFSGENLLKIITSVPGANPMIVGYNATGSLARFESKKILYYIL
jgi:hypothetical protein